MLKKLIVLAMVIGVVAGLALPASASAAWKHHATPLQQNAQVGLTGTVRFSGNLGGVECQITSRTNFLAEQTTALVETFVAHPTSDTANCHGTGGLFKCQIHNLTPQFAANWTAHTVQSPVSVSVTTTTIHSQATGAFCPVTTISLTAGSVTFTPDLAETVSQVSEAGNLQAHLTTTNGTVDTETVATSGTLTIEFPNAKTYSL
jgi:hypothetical protein